MKAKDLYEKFKDVDPVKASMEIDRQLMASIADIAEKRGIGRVSSLASVIREQDDLRRATHRLLKWPSSNFTLAGLAIKVMQKENPKLAVALKRELLRFYSEDKLKCPWVSENSEE